MLISLKMAFLVLFAAMIISVLASPPIHVAGQQPAGFLSIDCGLDAKDSGYTEKATGLHYVSDGDYVDGGENHEVASEYRYDDQEKKLLTLRSFPSGKRNCYALPTVAGAKYLARVETLYGNYDGRNLSSSSAAVEYMFDLYLGADYWETSKVGGDIVYEAVFVASASQTPVCLVDTDHGTPFVSAIDLRPLAPGLYPPVVPGVALSMVARYSLGTDNFTRYPVDQYDRLWKGATATQWANMSTVSKIQPDPSFAEPLPVLQTAASAARNGTTLNIAAVFHTKLTKPLLAFLHFADFQSAQLREFDIYLDGTKQWPSYTPSFQVASCIYPAKGNRPSSSSSYDVSLIATAKSVLPPMINAIEYYSVIPHGPETFAKDIDAIMAIKFEYGVKRNWMGDPCYPTSFAWSGVKCSNSSDNTTRITSIDLSNSNLHGLVSTNFTLLTALTNLDLSYNNLSGSIPDSLPSLPSLRVLNISGNHLSGNSLCKKNTGSLIFRYDSDKSMCRNPRKNLVVLVTSIVVPVLVVSAIFLTFFIWRAKRKVTVSANDHKRNVQLENAPSTISNGYHLQDTESRRFTYKDLEKFTDNFKHFLGQGGFGLVYYGHLEDGTEVAVKMRSQSSSHGLDEFLAEVQSLTKVHHRNIVSLVGYCWEKDHLALVYEYMSQGNLYDHLRGKIAAAETLNWGTRVQIVLEAAQGLDYLHKGCCPPIIHRDVKSSNILLSQNLQAKIADLGLSRTYINDAQTHISATAAGTAGYMDPEYYLTGRLTESSDAYSFGVVLLEAATGEPPMVPGHGHIVKRVKQRVASTGDIGSVADPMLGGAYDVNSMWKVVDTAMACTADAGAARPTMAGVVAQLRDSLALEHAREDGGDRSSVAASDSALMMSAVGPSAR